MYLKVEKRVRSGLLKHLIPIQEHRKIIQAKALGIIITAEILMAMKKELGAIQQTLLIDGNTVHVLVMIKSLAGTTFGNGFLNKIF